jgi:hypothetical protein
MPSPFPGMNPYIEDSLIWEDFHQNLASEIQAQLAPKLRPRYFASVTPKVTYEEILVESSSKTIKPDVGIWRTPSNEPMGGAAVAIAPEHIVPAPIIGYVTLADPVKQFTVEVREVKDKTLVASIEVLSPVNKRRSHSAFEEYQKKRNDLLKSDVHLLEIDLLRAGIRWPMPEVNLPASPYFVFLHRAGSGRIYIWPLKLEERIPALPVPLREPDADVYLDLTAAIHNIYDRAAYDLRIDYQEPPPKPELAPDELAFCKQVVANMNGS